MKVIMESILWMHARRALHVHMYFTCLFFMCRVCVWVYYYNIKSPLISVDDDLTRFVHIRVVYNVTILTTILIPNFNCYITFWKLEFRCMRVEKQHYLCYYYGRYYSLDILNRSFLYITNKLFKLLIMLLVLYIRYYLKQFQRYIFFICNYSELYLLTRYIFVPVTILQFIINQQVYDIIR